MFTKEAPVIEKDDSPVGDTVERHPSYGQIGASRVSASGGYYLYGSDFGHQHFVTITISRSELMRGLSNDWPHAKEELIEVALSEAQWASFVSSLNVGSGVQCTITGIGRESVPGIERRTNRHEQFGGELADNFVVAKEELRKLRQKLTESTLGKKAKDELLKHVERAEREIGSSSGFVVEQFGEHMEQTVEKAKSEVNAYMQHVLTRTGIKALAENAPLLLEEHATEGRQK